MDIYLEDGLFSAHIAIVYRFIFAITGNVIFPCIALLPICVLLIHIKRTAAAC